ncbi:MAG: RND family transporter [Mycobacterium sp.]
MSTDALPAPKHADRAGIALLIRRLAVPIILFWAVVIAVLNVSIPQLEIVGQMRAVAMSPEEAPSVIAMKRIGNVFNEFQSDSAVMIVLEGEQELGAEAHDFYDQMVTALEADPRHVEAVQDFWGEPLTEASAQSPDGKAVNLQVYLAGNQGEMLANDSVAAVQEIVAGIPPPEGVKAHVTGPAALVADQQIAGDRSLRVVEMVTFLVITAMLLYFFRSLVTVSLVLGMVVLSLAAARGAVAFLGYHEFIGLSTLATTLVVTAGVAATTDYAIFLIGRYQEARASGQDPESAYYIMFRGTAHVVLASGLTIAGAIFCLQFTRLPYLRSLAIPLAVAMVVVVLVALTLGAAMVTVASRFGLLEPKRQLRVQGWRKVGAAVARWPGPILIVTTGLALIGLLALPGYKASYNDRNYLPADLPANQGYAAADRHFSPARMNPELLMVESDHDLRNPADFLVIEKIAKSVFNLEGISKVQAATRPRGTPIGQASIPYQLSMAGAPMAMNMPYMRDRVADMRDMGDQMLTVIDSMEGMLELMKQMASSTDSMTSKMATMADNVADIRDQVANFDDFFRPIRNYFYWEPHCYNIPICWALRSLYDSIDGINIMTDDLQKLLPDMQRLNALMPQMLTLVPPMITTMKSMRVMMLTMQATMGGLQDQVDAMMDNSSAMGKAFDTANNDDSFYLPPEAFENEEFQRGMDMFLSPNGHAVQFIVSHEGNPMSPDAMARVEAIKTAAKQAIKGSPLEGSRIYLAGTASILKDMSDGNRYDLVIAGIASLSLVFIIMLMITRSLVAAAVIVGTVALSLGASFGLSVLIWQHVLGIELHWLVLPMSVIILLAVGADYNLLLVSRLKEEVHAGLKTGIIRAMGGSGSVVTAAGLVFSFTMMSMAVSELVVIGQVGTTIGLGLLFDTLVVRAFMTPSIAALLGRWFWWPQNIRTRPLRRRPAPT